MADTTQTRALGKLLRQLSKLMKGAPPGPGADPQSLAILVLVGLEDAELDAVGQILDAVVGWREKVAGDRALRQTRAVVVAALDSGAAESPTPYKSSPSKSARSEAAAR